MNSNLVFSAHEMAEKALRETRHLIEAARYIIEARQYVESMERAHPAGRTTLPGDIGDQDLAGLLYQAFERNGEASAELARIREAESKLKAA